MIFFSYSKKLFDYNNLYYQLLILFAASLPFSNFLLTLSQILLIANFLFNKGFVERISRIINRTVLVFLMLYLMHIVGLIYSSDYNYAMKDLRIKLPLLIIPIIVFTSGRISFHKIKNILLLFSFSVLAYSIVCIIYKFITPLENIKEPQNISFIISHIRLSLMIAFALSIKFYFSFINDNTSKNYKLLFTFSFAWYLYFSYQLEAFTAFVLIYLLILIFSFYLLKKYYAKSYWLYTSVYSILILAPIIFSVIQVNDFYNIKEYPKSDLTLKGNYYYNDTNVKMIENGYYVWQYICEKELKEEWNKISNINYDSADINKNPVRFTLFRYLTSLGLKKDANGVLKLNKEDIRAIERGLANYKYKIKQPLTNRLYKIIWEFDYLFKGYNASGHSISQRYYFWTASNEIFRNNPFIGVGTGDVDKSYNEIYSLCFSFVKKDFQLKSHNQYLRMLVAFGVIGFIIFIISILYPYIYTQSYKSFLANIFLLIIFLSMISEDTIETQTGVSLFVFFYSILILINQPISVPKNRV